MAAYWLKNTTPLTEIPIGPSGVSLVADAADGDDGSVNVRFCAAIRCGLTCMPACGAS